MSLAQLLRAGVLDAPQLVKAIWTQASEEALLVDQLTNLEQYWHTVELQLETTIAHGYLLSRIPCHSAYATSYRTKSMRNRTSVK